MAQSIEAEAARNKNVLIVCSSEGNGEKEFELIKMLRSKQVDGIIIAPTKTSQKGIDFLIEDKLPFVLIDRYFPNLNTNYVIVNNYQTSYDLVYHLLKKGSRKIALLTTDVHLYVMKRRIEGYRKALDAQGINSDLDLELFIERQNYEIDIVDKLDSLFKEVPDVDGFFFSTHYLALEAIRYFIKRKIDYHTRFNMGCFHDFQSRKDNIIYAIHPARIRCIHPSDILMRRLYQMNRSILKITPIRWNKRSKHLVDNNCLIRHQFKAALITNHRQPNQQTIRIIRACHLY